MDTIISTIIKIVQLASVSLPLWLPLAGNAADVPPTTREQTVRPLALPANTRHLAPNDVPLYKAYDYSAWQLGPGEDEGRKFDLMPAGYTGATNASRLLSFFSVSDVAFFDTMSQTYNAELVKQLTPPCKRKLPACKTPS